MPRGITFRNIADLVPRGTMNRKITENSDGPSVVQNELCRIQFCAT